MSKSTGNVVNPFFAMDRFGVDTMRFYFAHDGSIDSDADYGNSRILERYKTALQGGFEISQAESCVVKAGMSEKRLRKALLATLI